MAVTDDTRRISQTRKRELRDLSDAQIVAIASAWVALWDDLEGEYDRAIQDLVAAYPDGATAAQLAADDLIAQTMEITQRRVSDLVDEAADRIALDMPEAARIGAITPVEVLQSQLPPLIGMDVSFSEVSEGALAAIVARTTSRITSETRPLSGAMTDAVRSQLTQGIAAGSNPREVARRVVADVEGAFNGGLARASTIARTEMLDANRAASQATAEENLDVIQAQIWVATLDARTCMSCVSMHGEEFPPDAFGPEDHPNGRCTFIAKLKPWEELGIVGVDEPPDQLQDAQAWFDNLTEDTQRAMLGPGKYDLWANGDMSWDDMSVKRDNSDWRAAYYERSLRDMPGG